jgi:hypothetical protein
MAAPSIWWDLDDDPDGNVQHIAEHGITKEEVEQVLTANYQDAVVSRTSGNPIVFGATDTGKYIAVVFEMVQDDPLSVYPLTAYEVNPPSS